MEKKSKQNIASNCKHEYWFYGSLLAYISFKHTWFKSELHILSKYILFKEFQSKQTKLGQQSLH